MCLDTYTVDKNIGWWRNYYNELSLGYKGTYDDYVRSLYMYDLRESLLLTVTIIVCVVLITVLFLAFYKFLKYVFNRFSFL